MGLPSVKVGGTVRDAKRATLRINLKLGERASAEALIDSLDGLWRPAVGNLFEALDGTDVVWTGNIDSVVESSFTEAAPTGRRYNVAAVSWEQRLDKRLTYDSATGTIPCYTRNCTFTADPATDYLTAPGHGRSNGDMVRLKTSEGGTLPWGTPPLAANTDYWVRDVSGDTFKLALTLGGAAIDITDAGDGIHKLITYRAGEIAADLLTNYAGSEGITPADIDLGAVVDKAIFDCASVAEALSELASLSNYVWWIDNDKGLHFVARTVNAAPFDLASIGGNYRHLSVRTTREEVFNDGLMRVNWSQFPVTEERFAGDGATRNWILAHRAAQISYIRVNEHTEQFVFTANPATDLLTAAGHTAVNGQKVRVKTTGTLPAPLTALTDYYARDVSGDDLKLAYIPGGNAINITTAGTGTHTLIITQSGDWYEQTFGEDGVEADKDFYWALGETGIRQDNSREVLAATASLAVGYHPLGSNIVSCEDGAAITARAGAEGGSGRYTRCFDRTDTGEGQIQAYDRAQALIAIYKLNARQTAYETDMLIEALAKNLRPGQLQGIVNSYFNITGGWLIDEVQIEDVGGQWLKFTVKALDGTYLGGWLEFFRDLARGRAGVITLTGNVGTGGSRGSSGAGGYGGYYANHLLTAPTTEIEPPPEALSPLEGERLTICLLQDGTGGRLITWSSHFKAATPDINTDLNTLSVFNFVARADGKWWPSGPPITGVSTV